LSKLRQMVGYAASQTSGETIVCVPGPPLLFADSERLAVYTWSTDRISTIEQGVHVSERGIRIER
jgi:hypothetical protein